MNSFFSTSLFAIFLHLFISFKIYSQVPGYQWAHSAGKGAIDQAKSVAVDGGGNVIVTGYFISPSIVFGTYTLTNTDTSGTSDVFIVKYSPSGTVKWAKSFGGSNSDGANGISCDPGGNIFVTGTFGSSVAVAGSYTITNSGPTDFFILKCDSAGSVLWAKSGGASGSTEGNSVSNDAAGNAVVVGEFTGATFALGSNTLTNVSSNYDIFIVKYDPSGNILWAHSAGSTGSDLGLGVDCDNGGNIITSGRYQGSSIAFGTFTLTNAGSDDAFVVKFNSSGNVQWAKSVSGSSLEYGLSVDADPGGNVLLAGVFLSNTLTVSTHTLTSAGMYDIFLVKYDPLGNVLFARSEGGTYPDWACDVGSDNAGNILLTGYYGSATLAFGTYTLTNAGFYDVFVTKYDASGNVQWATSNGGANEDVGEAIGCGTSGDITLTGYFNSPGISFGSHVLSNAGNYDVFVAKLNGTTGFWNDVDTEPGATIYPNPFSDVAELELKGLSENYILNIYDLCGTMVNQQQIHGTSAKIDRKELSDGIYFYKLISDKNAIIGSGKLIVQ